MRTGRTFRMLLRLALAMSEDKVGTSFVLVADNTELAFHEIRNLNAIFAAKCISLERDTSDGTYSLPFAPHGQTLSIWGRRKWEGTHGRRFRATAQPYELFTDHYDSRCPEWK